MNKIYLMFAISISICTVASAQEKTPALLVDAVKCLSMKNNFPSSTISPMTFGYLIDNKSYPSERVLYVVRYENVEGSDGFVFSLFLKNRKGIELFNIQNNAQFNLTEKGIAGINFADPPLGGSWTQEHLAYAIRKIEKKRRFSISFHDLSKSMPSWRCNSYVDH